MFSKGIEILILSFNYLNFFTYTQKKPYIFLADKAPPLADMFAKNVSLFFWTVAHGNRGVFVIIRLGGGGKMTDIIAKKEMNTF